MNEDAISHSDHTNDSSTPESNPQLVKYLQWIWFVRPLPPGFFKIDFWQSISTTYAVELI